MFCRVADHDYVILSYYDPLLVLRHAQEIRENCKHISRILQNTFRAFYKIHLAHFTKYISRILQNTFRAFYKIHFSHFTKYISRILQNTFRAFYKIHFAHLTIHISHILQCTHFADRASSHSMIMKFVFFSSIPFFRHLNKIEFLLTIHVTAITSLYYIVRKFTF